MRTLRATDLQVGMEVYACNNRYRHHSEYGKVIRITNSGQIVVNFGEGKEPCRFNKDGLEIGTFTTSSYRRYLVDATQARAWDKLTEAKKKAANRLNAIKTLFQERYSGGVDQNWSVETMEEFSCQIANTLTEARELVELAKIADAEFADVGGYPKV